MSLTEEELIQQRIDERKGKLRELSKENSPLQRQPFTPTIPDKTPLDLQSVFPTDVDGYNPFESKYIRQDNVTKTKLPEKYKIEALANKQGPLHQGGNKSKKNKKRNKSKRLIKSKRRRSSRK
jgi:hypothetical protein